MARAIQLSRAIEKVYAAATDPRGWRDALAAVEDFTGSTGAVVDLVPVIEGARPHSFAGSFSPEDCLHYATHYQAICPRIRFARAHPEVPVQHDRMILSEHEMDRDPVYDWLGSHGLRYYIGAPVGHTGRHLAFLSLQRSRKQGPANADAIAALDMIRPHVAQALALADMLDMLSAHRSFSDAMLDAMPQAVFALDAQGVLLFANSAGEWMLQNSDCLGAVGGRLAVADRQAQAELDSLIRAAAGGGRGGVMRLASTSGRRPRALRVSAIRTEHHATFVQSAVLAVVSDPGRARLDEAVAETLYDLTRAEARTAAALVEGHSIKSAAQALAVSPETIRSHLKALFRKVGVSRQQDLIRTLQGLETQSVAQPR